METKSGVAGLAAKARAVHPDTVLDENVLGLSAVWAGEVLAGSAVTAIILVQVVEQDQENDPASSPEAAEQDQKESISPHRLNKPLLGS